MKYQIIGSTMSTVQIQFDAPGRVILQTQNFNEFAGRIAKMIPGK